jgi:hypothetical protein
MYSKAPHFTPHDNLSHEPDITQHGDHDEIGLIHAICVKEYSSAKRKELYKQVQLKRGILKPTQLLLDMKVWWSSTYVMINCTETNKEVRYNSTI